jgi:hypothetical protein
LARVALPDDYTLGARLWAREQLEFVMPFYVWDILLWSLAALLPMFALVAWLRQHSRRDYLVLRGESGQSLKIRSQAIADYIRDELMRLPFVRKILIEADSARGALAVTIHAWIETNGQFRNMQDVMQARAQAAAETGLGIARVADIEINFESVRLIKTSRKQLALEQASAPDETKESREATYLRAAKREEERGGLDHESVAEKGLLPQPWRPNEAEAVHADDDKAMTPSEEILFDLKTDEGGEKSNSEREDRGA